MLVLTRRSGEQIRIGEDIVLTIVRVKGNHVRIGFTAPRTVSIQRVEADRRFANRPVVVGDQSIAGELTFQGES